MPDALTLLKTDHDDVKLIFQKINAASSAQERSKHVNEAIRELSIHAAIEEQVFYPRISEQVPGVQQMVEEGLVEHQQVKELLAKLEDLEPENAEFEATAKVMMEDIEHHLSEEEDELFPQVRAGMSQQQLEEIAGELESAKKVAPTHPHPKAPNTPPGNLVAGAAAAVMDRAKDAIKRD